jgi:tetratricopeptide (TPR) repeat protein
MTSRRQLHAALLGLATGLAVATTLRAADRDPKNDEHYAACVALTQRAPESALESAMTWRDQGGGPAARHCVALALIALKQYTQAAERLETLALDMKAEGPAAQVAVMAQAGNAWLLAGYHPRARDVLTAALETAPDDVDLLIDRARAYAGMHEFDAAFRDLDKAVALDPERDDALSLRAAARRHTGDMVRALEDAELALALNPGNAEARLERGILRRDAGNIEGARADFLRIATDHGGTPVGDAAQAQIEGMDLKVKTD